jgi:hypothetical protein
MQSESGAARWGLSRQPRGKGAAAVNTAPATTVAIHSENQTGLPWELRSLPGSRRRALRFADTIRAQR